MESLAHAQAMKTGAGCKDCPLDHCGRGPVIGELRKVKLFILGEAPGKQEIREGFPFVGQSGGVLEEALKRGGLRREDTSISNTTLCQPPPGFDFERYNKQCKAKNWNRPQDMCFDRLVYDLNYTDPKVILTLGKQAMLAVARRYSIPVGKRKSKAGDRSLSSIKFQRGHPYELPDGRVLVPTLHPAYALRAAKQYLQVIRDDIVMACNIVNHGLSWGEPSYIVTTEIDQLQAIRWNPDAPLMVDIETAGIKTESAIRCIGVTQGNQNIIVPLQTLWGAPYWSREAYEHVRETVSGWFERHTLQFQNGPFDTRLLLYHGFLKDRQQTWEDLRTYHYAGRECDLPHDLNHISSRFCEVPLWKSDVDHKAAEFEYEKLSDEDRQRQEEAFHQYTAYDIVTQRISMDGVKQWVKEDGTERQIAIDTKLAPIARDMGELGMFIDVEKREELRQKCDGKIGQALNDLRKLTDVAFNPNSSQQVAKWLYKEWDCPEFTSDGDLVDSEADKAGTGEKALLKLQDHGVPQQVNMFIEGLLRFRGYSKLRGTYLTDKHDEPTKWDGIVRMRPTYLVPGTTTGRFASNPNCFDANTEILTESGWVYFPNLRKGVKIAQFHPKDQSLEFVEPTAYWSRDGLGMCRIKNQNLDIYATQDHRMLMQTRNGNWETMSLDGWKPDRKVYHAGTLKGGIKLPIHRIRLLCALQADAWYDQGIAELSFSKKRKIDRLACTLEALEIKHTRRPKRNGKSTQTRFRFNIPDWCWSYLSATKKWFTPKLLQLSLECRNILAQEVMRWDGCITRMNHYASQHKCNADAIQAVYLSIGKKAKVRIYRGSVSPSYQVDVEHKAYTWSTNVEPEIVIDPCEVFCVSVPSSYIVVRRNGKPVVIGNCQNWPSRGLINCKTMILAPPDHKIVIADYDQLEARLFAEIAQDKLVLDCLDRGRDIHSATAAALFSSLYPDYDEEELYRLIEENKNDKSTKYAAWRHTAKTIRFGKQYGAGAGKLFTHMSTLRDKVTNERQFPRLQRSDVNKWDKAWEKKNPWTKVWQQRVIKFCQENGYVEEPIHGRRRYFKDGANSPNEVPNMEIQGGAAACANRAMIEIGEKIPHYCWSDLTGLAGQVHDELYGYYPDNKVEEACVVYNEAMNFPFRGVMITAKAEVRERWSE